MRVKFWVFSLLVVFLTSAVQAKPGDWPNEFPDPAKKVDQYGMPMETIRVSQAVSGHITGLNIQVSLPPNYQFLSEAKPFVRLFSPEDGEIAKFELEEPVGHFSLNAQVSSARVFAEVGLFYCRQGALGLCLIKKLLYDIPVSQTGGSENLNLGYIIQEEY